MQATEIRMNRKFLFFFIALLIIGVIGMSYMAFFTEKGKNNTSLLIIDGVMTIILVYSITRMIRMLKKNEPVITLTTSAIDINENGKLTSFIWPQISSWKIEKDDNNMYLVIEAGDTRKKVSISWLEKNPSQIEELIKEYSNKPSAFNH